MSTVDPRRTLKQIIFAVITTTKDDGVTPANILVMYEGGPETYRYLFHTLDYDVVMTIGRHREEESGAGKRRQDVPVRYNRRIPLYVSAVDKDGVTATIILNKMRHQIQHWVEVYAQTTDNTWILERNDSNNMRMGGIDPVWQDRYTVYQRPME